MHDYQVKLKTDRWTDGNFIGSSIYGGPKNDSWSLLYHKMVHFSKHGLIPLFLQTTIHFFKSNLNSTKMNEESV